MEPASPNDPDARSLTKDGDELTIVYSASPDAKMMAIIRDVIDGNKSRGGVDVQTTSMKGSLDATESKSKGNLASKLMINAALIGSGKAVSINFHGSGSKAKKTAEIKRIVADFETKWIRLFEKGGPLVESQPASTADLIEFAARRVDFRHECRVVLQQAQSGVVCRIFPPNGKQNVGGTDGSKPLVQVSLFNGLLGDDAPGAIANAPTNEKGRKALQTAVGLYLAERKKDDHDFILSLRENRDGTAVIVQEGRPTFGGPWMVTVTLSGEVSRYHGR